MKCAFIDLGKDYGGAENYLISLARNWIKAGNECSIICRKSSLFYSKLKKNDLNKSSYATSFSIFELIKMKRMFSKEKYDFVHVNGINSGIFALLVNNKRAIRITTVHSNCKMDRMDKPQIFVRIFEMLENLCLKKSHGVIAVSQAISDLLVKRGIRGDKISVIYNGIKEKQYPHRIERKSVEPLKICYVGRLESVKGCDVLLDALSKLKGVNYQCDIWGDGSQRQGLESYSKDLGLCDTVHFKGYSSCIRDVLINYDVLVQPSRYEAFPLSLIEAMNAQTEIICSHVGGMPEVVKDGITGYTFEVGDYYALSQILGNIYNNPKMQRRIIENAFISFLNNYTEKVMIDKTFSMFRKVCESQ